MNELANSLSRRDVDCYLHGYTNFRKHERDGAMVVLDGSGIRVRDENGKEYLEGMAGLWCNSLGYSEERLIEAAVRQMRRLPAYHCFNHRNHEPGVMLAERLKALAPVPMSKVFFANSGSEANDTAIKLVWYYGNATGRPEKKKIISRNRGYHGVTVATASLTGLAFNHRSFDLPIARILHADCPHHYHEAEPGESETDFATRLAENLDRMIEEEGPETVGAFIAEPVMGAGGVVVPPETYFPKIQAVLKRHDVLLIVDEVICGFGRTGNYWGSQTVGAEPDILTCAKALSAGYVPISAMMISDKVYQAIADETNEIGTFGHGFTYSGHPLAAAVALETLDIYEERDIVGHVRQVAPALQQGLRKLADRPIVGEVRGVGLVAAVELVRDKETKEKFDPKAGVGAYLAARAEEAGLILRAMAGDSISFCPPLIATEAELGDIVTRFAEALDDTVAWAGESGLIEA